MKGSESLTGRSSFGLGLTGLKMACEHEGQEAAVLMDRIIVSSDFSVVTVCVP